MGRTVINETENKQTIILNDSPEGVTGGYFDADMVWTDIGADQWENISDITTGYDLNGFSKDSNKDYLSYTTTALNYTGHIYSHYCKFKYSEIAGKKLKISYDYEISGITTENDGKGFLCSVELFTNRTVSTGTGQRLGALRGTLEGENKACNESIYVNGSDHVEAIYSDLTTNVTSPDDAYVGLICYAYSNASTSLKISNLKAEVLL